MKNTYELSYANADLFGYLMDGFSRINDADRKERKAANKESFSEEIGTLEDRVFAGAAMVAIRMTTLLPSVIERFHAKIDAGVFAYDHLDYDEQKGTEACLSLPAFMWRWMASDASYWLLVTDHLRVDDLPLEDALEQWCGTAGLALQETATAAA